MTFASSILWKLVLWGSGDARRPISRELLEPLEVCYYIRQYGCPVLLLNNFLHMLVQSCISNQVVFSMKPFLATLVC